jgi:HEPN domain-containing protein
MRVLREPNYDAVCFHAQPCAEKYLKAFLTQNRLPFRFIHDLEALLGQILPISGHFETIRDPLLLLNDYVVDIRYPGEIATKAEARASLEAIRQVRAYVRRELEIGTSEQETEQPLLLQDSVFLLAVLAGVRLVASDAWLPGEAQITFQEAPSFLEGVS